MKADQRRRVLHTLACEQKALKNLSKSINASFGKALDLLRKRRGKIIVIGVGKSGFVGMKLAATLTSLGHPAHFLHPVEALHGDLGIVTSGDIVIALSFSGESKEITKIITHLKKLYVLPVIALTGSGRSTLSRLSKCTIAVAVTEEGCPLNLAPMASATSLMVLGDLLVAGLTDPRTFAKNRFASYHPGGLLGLSLTKVSKRMAKGSHMPLVKASASLAHAISTVSKKRRGCAGVLSERGLLIGIITDGDIRRFVERHGSIENYRAQDAMTKNPKVIESDKSLKDALALMEKYKITVLFALNVHRRPVGIIHIHDIADQP